MGYFKKLSLAFLIGFLPFLGFSQYSIEVQVQKVPSSNGTINIALYNTDHSFLNTDSAFYSMTASAKEGTTTLYLKDIPEGTYAIALYHDVNANNELETNWLGIPKEKVAFSNSKMKTFGPPSFKDCAFKVKQNVVVQATF